MLVSKKQLKEMVLYSYAHIDRLENPGSPYHDPSFPKRVRIGNNRVGWVKVQVEHWIQAKIAQHDNSA